MKIRKKLESLSSKLEHEVQTLNEMLGSENVPQTTKDLAEKLVKSIYIFRETELDSDMISRMQWFPQMLVSPDDFSIVLSNWLEDEITLLKETRLSLGGEI